MVEVAGGILLAVVVVRYGPRILDAFFIAIGAAFWSLVVATLFFH